MKSSVFVIVLALVAMQVSATTIQKESEIATQGIITNEIAKALEILKRLVNAAVDDAEATVNAILEGLKPTLAAIISSTTDIFVKDLQPLIKLIEAREEAAKKAGKDVSGCEHFKNDLLDLVPELNARVSQGVQEILDEVICRINKLFDNVRELLKIIDDLEEAFRNCNSLFCLPGILTEVLKYTISLPLQIANIAREAIGLASDASGSATRLALDETRIALEKASNITKGAIECLIV